ncbi:MAG TPA: tripartite tricarboxylate transporter substrate binding protein [Burkholderiales bacterium]|jgi:tripartite-type tricarboxylate transporter receptor subunit TctC|nr:tripartite tricarboxylate transporter substrate binding protein [Burkholderiales bacterium]
MKASRRTVLKTVGTLAALALPGSRVLAAYPERPIKLVVPFAPGGNADIVGRLVAEGMAQALGQPMIVENRAGAGGGVGAAEVARAAPDGYTLLSGSNGPLTVNPFVQSNLSYDPLKDFLPIGLTSLAPHALIVNAAVPAKAVAELVALSKKQQVGVGTSGIGSATHLTLERFNAQTGAKLVHVPYKGGGALLPDLVAGTIQGAMTEFSSALPHHRSGKARFIAVASAKRLAQAPDVPTMIESGVADFTAASYIGVLAPARTPADVLSRLQSALASALKSPKTLERMKELGIEPATPELMTASGFGAFIRREYESSRQAVKLAGLQKQ